LSFKVESSRRGRGRRGGGERKRIIKNSPYPSPIFIFYNGESEFGILRIREKKKRKELIPCGEILIPEFAYP